MTTSKRSSWLLWTGVGLLVVFAAASGLIYLSGKDRYEADPSLLEELADAKFAEEPVSDGSNWPAWRGVYRNGVTAAPGLITDWPKQGPEQLWNASAGEGYSAIVVADGRAFTMGRTGEEEQIICWDAETGKEIWRKGYNAPVTIEYGDGPRSTPAVVEGRIYSVGVGGRLQCRQVEDGALLWEHDLLAEYQAKNLRWGVTFSPLVDGDLVLTMPGGSDAAFVAFDRTTGAEVWKSHSGQAGYASPVALTVGGQRMAVFFTGTSVVGVSTIDGKVHWTYDWRTSFEVNAATPLAFTATIASGDQPYLFITSGYDQGCALLKLNSNDAGEVSVQRVYEGTSMRGQFSSPVRLGDHAYGFDEARLACVDLRTGKARWTKTGFGRGGLLRAGEHLIVMGERGNLALIEASPEECKIRTEHKVFRGDQCWTMPAYAAGRLYVRNQDKVVCLKVATMTR